MSLGRGLWHASSGFSMQLERLLEGYCLELMATNENPEQHNGAVKQFAKDLVLVLAKHLSERIASLLRFWTIPPKCSMTQRLSRFSCPSFGPSSCIGNFLVQLRDADLVVLQNSVVQPVDWSKAFANPVTEFHHIKLAVQVEEGVGVTRNSNRASFWPAFENGLGPSAGSIHCTFGSRPVGRHLWWKQLSSAMRSGWHRPRFNVTPRCSRLPSWQINMPVGRWLTRFRSGMFSLLEPFPSCWPIRGWIGLVLMIRRLRSTSPSCVRAF